MRRSQRCSSSSLMSPANRAGRVCLVAAGRANRARAIRGGLRAPLCYNRQSDMGLAFYHRRWLHPRDAGALRTTARPRQVRPACTPMVRGLPANVGATAGGLGRRPGLSERAKIARHGRNCGRAFSTHHANARRRTGHRRSRADPPRLERLRCFSVARNTTTSICCF